MEKISQQETNLALSSLQSLETATKVDRSKQLAALDAFNNTDTTLLESKYLPSTLPLDENDQKAKDAVDRLFSFDLKDPHVQAGLTQSASKMNQPVMKRASQFTSDKLNARIGLLNNEGTNGVYNHMLDLNKQLREIHPSNFDLTENFFTKFLPFLSPVRKYFEQFKSTQEVINETKSKLEDSVNNQKLDIEILKKDKFSLSNIAVEVKKGIDFNQKLKQRIEDKILTEVTDEETKTFLESQILFTITREIQGLQELLTVNMQGQQSFEMCIRSGADLIDSAVRCINVSVNALTIAAVVAHVITGQRKMLEAIKAVNETATSMIEHNRTTMSTTLKDISQQAVQTNLDVDVLVRAIDMSIQAIEDDVKFRQSALPKMNENIARLSEATQRAEKSTAELEKARIIRENYDSEAEKVFTV